MTADLTKELVKQGGDYPSFVIPNVEDATMGVWMEYIARVCTTWSMLYKYTTFPYNCTHIATGHQDAGPVCKRAGNFCLEMPQ